MQGKPPSYPIESVDHALRLLLALRARGQLRVADAAAELGVAPSTAHRLLTMLRYRDFAVQDGRKIYRPGPAFDEMLPLARPGTDLRVAAGPHLSELRRELGETVHLMVLEGNGVRFVDGAEGTHVLRVGLRTGMLLPAHCTSGGKALLAELPFEDLRARYPRGLFAVTTATITGMAALRRELAAIRKRGYATNYDESVQGISAISVCVRDRLGRSVAALAAAVPSARFARPRAPDIAAALHRTAQRIAEAL